LEDRIRRRIEEGHDVSDAHAHILKRQIEEMEEPVELPYYRVMRLNTETSLHDIVSALKELL
jgi:predicted kinase